MSDLHDRDLEFAVALAGRAGEVLTRSYEQVLQVDRKSKRDVVTDVDYASEALVIEAIRARYPADAILAEESGRHERSDGGAVLTTTARNPWSRRTWVIDPLDGTVNYANGIPFFCVSIALVEAGRPTVGVVLDPLRGDCYAATADGPATLNGRTVHASTKEALGDFVVSMAIIGRGGIARERRVGSEIRIARRMGSASLGLAYVASGRFDAVVQNGGLSHWDIAAAGLIAERAGATVTDLYGGPWWNVGKRPPRLSIVAAPPAHHARLLELLRAARTTVQTRR
ncbi:MAG TPA: inositol monophosphatase family protein [Candidatus Limnocylindria bacterium]|jgi:myo-inositol-1(or 4)-monophosphatase